MWWEINQHKSDSRGSLAVVENRKDLPFDIKRAFYIKSVPKGATRGHHAHIKTKQVLMVIQGSCIIELSDGTNNYTYNLNKPHAAVYQKELVWGHMHSFTTDCILLVFADTLYDANDYIHDYEVFVEYAGKNVRP
ncbi:FdtA/QdtA family cupin domain-containing protein [bacterium]|nr:FdtA/QdtA family cupin domain-containing protein [bacterium]